MTTVGYLVADPLRLTAEEEAGWRYLLSRGDVRNALVPFGAVPRTRRRFDVLWWHSDASGPLPHTALETAVKAAVLARIRAGSGLLLTLQAARYAAELGVEPVAPNRIVDEPWSEESWARGYPDIRGIGSLLGHPVFEGLGGGAYLWAPRKGARFSAAFHQAPACPQGGRVIGVGRRYIRLDEDLRLCTEYRTGRGRILAVGAFTVFAEPRNPFRSRLERFADNCIDYVSPGGERSGRRASSWSFEPWRAGPVTLPDLPALEHGDRKRPEESGISLPAAPGGGAPFDLGGRRILFLGEERGPVNEVWTHPFRAIGNIRFALREGRGKPVWLDESPCGVTIRPESVTRTYALGGTRIEEVIFADHADPCGAVDLRIECKRRVDLFLTFTADHRIMWPMPERAAGPMQFGWSHGLQAAVVESPNARLTTVCGATAPAARVLLGAFTGFALDGHGPVPQSGGGGSVGGAFTFRCDPGSRRITFAFAGSHRSRAEAVRAYRRIAGAPATRLTLQARRFRRLLRRTTGIETPDEAFNEALLWAAVSLDRFRADTPEVGAGILAGFAESTKGWDGGQKVSGRPGYAWYFGRDGAWTGFAFLALGETDAAREHLLLLGEHQDPSGKILHELTTSGHAHYDASDATPLYVILMERYLRATGDRKFVRAQFRRVAAAIAYCRSTDTDGDGLIENTAGGHGWIEGGPLFPIHVELYLAACWGAALEAASALAAAVGHGAEAAGWKREAADAGKLIEERFWNPKTAFYNAGISADGSPVEERTVLPAAAMALGMLDRRRCGRMVEDWAGEGFSTPWGVRIVDRESRHYKPGGYHYGSIWPLFTGWAALASYAAGKPDEGYAHLRRNLDLHRMWAAGCFPEVLHGEERRSSGVCHRQAWSAGMALLPALEGMLGMKVDAPGRTLALHPQLPPSWPWLRVRRIALGKTRVSFHLLRRHGETVCRFASTGPAVRVRFTFPAGFPVPRSHTRVERGGRPVPFTVDRTGSAVSFLLSGPTTLCFSPASPPRAST